MAATPTVGTPPPAPKAPAKAAAKTPPAAEAAPAASGAGESEGGGLNAILENLTPESAVAEDTVEGAEAEAGEGEAGEAAPETETETEALAKAEPSKSKLEEAVKAEDLFTEEALSSPEGVTRAREVLRAAQKELTHRSAKLDRYELRLDARAKKDEASRQESVAVVQRVSGIGQAIQREAQMVRSQSAPARERLAAFGRIVGVDGVALFEELSLGIAQDGRAPKPTPGEQVLTTRLEELERQRVRDREAADAAAVTGRVEALNRGIEQKMAEIEADCSNVEAFPVLAGQIGDGAFDAREAATWVADYMAAHFKKTKKSLARADAIRILETRLAKATGRAERAGQSPERSSGTLPKVPSSPARSAGTRGVTVTPTLADRSTGKGRKLSEQERLSEAARDPELMGAIFGPLR